MSTTGPYKEGKDSSEFKGLWGGVVVPALTSYFLIKGMPMEQANQIIVSLAGTLAPAISVVAYIIHRYKIKKMASQPNEFTEIIMTALKEDPELRKAYVQKFLDKGEVDVPQG